MPVIRITAPTNSDNIEFGPGVGANMANGVEALPNGAGTMVLVCRKVSGNDAMGLMDLVTPGAEWWHSNMWSGSNQADDDGITFSTGPAFTPATTDLVMIALTLPPTGTSNTFHNKNLTTGAAAVHSAGTANGGKRAMTGTNVYIKFGSFSISTFTGDLFAAAIWDVQLTNAQIDECWANARTSDIWNNSAGNPDFLTEFNTLTPVDLAGQTAFHQMSSVATLTGSSTGWTFDGVGVSGPPPIIQQPYEPAMKSMRPSGLYL